MLDVIIAYDLLVELRAEKERLLDRKSEIEWELGNDNSQLVDYEYVRDILGQLLYKASAEQINVKNRKIEDIELNFERAKFLDHVQQILRAELPKTCRHL